MPITLGDAFQNWNPMQVVDPTKSTEESAVIKQDGSSDEPQKDKGLQDEGTAEEEGQTNVDTEE